MSRRRLTELFVPVPEEKNMSDGVLFERTTTEEDSRLVMGLFAHWPNWALDVLLDGLERVRGMKGKARKELHSIAAKERDKAHRKEIAALPKVMRLAVQAGMKKSKKKVA